MKYLQSKNHIDEIILKYKSFMNSILIFTLKTLRKIFIRIAPSNPTIPQRENNPEIISQLIYNKLISNKPCMIARFGSVELNAITNYRGIKQYKNHYIDFIKGKSPQWWWNKKGLQEMRTNAGFFPSTPQMAAKFSEMMINDMPLVDILASWRPEENYFKEELKQASFVNFELINPYWSKTPWTKALKGKKILVIHPFAETIKKQYARRELLFKNPDILPKFELKTIKAVQSLGRNDQFKTWFDALKWMKDEMDKIDYDICLIGCGAYVFPLAVHAKKTGKKAVHLAGALQLLFGIRGARWEDPNYNKNYNYASLMNEYWVKPSENEKPQNAQHVEGACYW